MNKEGDGLESSWYGTVTLQPQRGGEEPSNYSSDYLMVLNNKSPDIFDKNPEVKTTFETISFSQKAVLGIHPSWPRQETKWNCYLYH